ncbi:phage tail tape measure protein [Neptunomonas japonica]|uniref:phage tail tape measure protein n=1 Tax=Neptunomonas japonica TaxID=417574 RepID=UPI0003FE635E|nr:phage tail tape measure protein [Neptunomonas japonica]
MALRETALSILIRARDLASAPLARFRREVESTDNSSHQATASVDELGDALSNSAQEASLFSQGLSFVSARLGGLLAGAAALVGFGGALQSSREFEAQLSKVNAVAGASTEEFSQLKAAAEEAGSTTRYTATQAAEGLEILARAGVGVNDSISLLPTLLNVATAEQLGLAEAASLVTDTLSIMGLAIDKGASSADILAKGASLSNTTMQQLGQAISYTGQYAKESDFDLAKLVATLDVLASNGLRGERAGTGLRSILAQLSDPATKAAKAVSGLGIDVKDFDAVIEGLKSPAAEAQAAINAFGIEAGPTLRALIAEGTEGIDTFKAALQGSEGAVKQMADTVSNNLDGAMVGFDSRLDSIKRKLTDPLLKPLARDLKDFTQSLSELSPAFATFGNGVTFIYDRVSGVVKFFGNSFALALESAAAVGATIPIVLAEIELAVDKLLNKAGLVEDATVKRLEIQVGALKAARNALVKEAVEDANDAENAIKQLFGALDQAGDKSTTVTSKAAEGIKGIGDAADEASPKVNSFSDAAKAAKAAFNQMTQSDVKKYIKTLASGIEDLDEKFKKGTLTVEQYTLSKEHLSKELAKSKKLINEETEAANKNNQAIEKRTTAVEDNTDATDKNTESVRANRGAALTLAGQTGAAWDAASEQMGAAYDRLTDGMANAVSKFGSLPRAAFSYVKDFANAYWDAEKAAVRLQKSYDQQQASLEQHLTSLTEADTVTEAMVANAERAVNSYDLLGEQQLSPLRNAISAIKSDMDSLTGSLESTVSGLQDELDRLNGDAVAIEDRAYKKKRDALEEQADLAAKQNNSDASSEAREALRLLEKTYQIKRSQAQEQQAQSQQAPSGQGLPSKTVRVEFQNATGGSYSGDFDNDGAAQLLAQLEGARFVSS